MSQFLAIGLTPIYLPLVLFLLRSLLIRNLTSEKESRSLRTEPNWEQDSRKLRNRSSRESGWQTDGTARGDIEATFYVSEVCVSQPGILSLSQRSNS